MIYVKKCELWTHNLVRKNHTKKAANYEIVSAALKLEAQHLATPSAGQGLSRSKLKHKGPHNIGVIKALNEQYY